MFNLDAKPQKNEKSVISNEISMQQQLLLSLPFGLLSIFDVASPEAEKIRILVIGFLIAALAILVLVTTLAVYISIKYRAKDTSNDPPQISNNKKLELWMAGIPLMLVTGFFCWSVSITGSIHTPRTNQVPDVIITSHQWWWSAAYPGSNVITANEIHVPAGKKLLLVFHSADVIHDWWIPALGGKMDIIPGVENYLWVTISKAGTYEGACSEFCGQQHAWMRISVVAEPPADYNKWLAENSQNANAPVDGMAKAGEALFLSATCSNCHHIKGTSANGTEGPDLTHFGSRQGMLTGLMDNAPENVYKWLSDPQLVKPGANMPRFIFKEDNLKALTAYLTQLR